MCTNGGSRYSVPLRVIPERGKVCENCGESSTAKSPDVFHDRETGSNVANEARNVSPDSGALTVQAGALAGRADVLTGEPATDAVDGVDAESSNSGSVEGSHVVMDGHSGPVLREHAPAPRVDFAESDGLKAGALEAQREPADAAAHVENARPHAASR